jgi:hypothetical protein
VVKGLKDVGRVVGLAPVRGKEKAVARYGYWTGKGAAVACLAMCRFDEMRRRHGC